MITLVARRALVEHARRPLNIVLLLAVPTVLVLVWGGTLADFAKLLGGTANQGQIEAATAGWAAAAVAGLAGFFVVTNAHGADRRLAAAAGRTWPVVAGRLGGSFALAVLAATAGLVALAARTGIRDPSGAVVATFLAAIIYLALGALVGTLVRSEMNGALIVTLAWVFDVFLGPGMGADSLVVTRLFPLHFPTLLLKGQVSGHAGVMGDIGWALAWAVGLSVVTILRLIVTTRPAPRAIGAGPTFDAPVVASSAPATAGPAAPDRWTRHASGDAPTGARARVVAGLVAGVRDYRRNRVLWSLLVIVPAIFIGLAIAVTPDTPGPVALVDGARRFTGILSERRMHAATMVPITAAFLAGIAGLFVVTGAADGDRRLVLAGFRAREVLAGRLGVIAAATVATTTVAVAVSGAWYPPRQWAVFAATNLLIALTYAMIGVLVGPITGRLGGLYLLLLLAFIDVGLGQSIMFGDGPPAWGAYLPARGASRVMIDAAFTSRFDEGAGLLLGLAWLLALVAAASVVYQRQTGSRAHRALLTNPHALRETAV